MNFIHLEKEKGTPLKTANGVSQRGYSQMKHGTSADVEMKQGSLKRNTVAVERGNPWKRKLFALEKGTPLKRIPFAVERGSPLR